MVAQRWRAVSSQVMTKDPGRLPGGGWYLDTMTTAVEGALRDAIALEEQGRVRDAIDLLTSTNRASRDPRLEIELVRLRRDGHGRIGPRPAAIPQPAIVPDPPGDGALFEIGPDELSVEALRAGWASTGCLVVRHLVDDDTVK